MGAAPVDFSSIPMAAGKTKMLWDAIRTAGVGPNGEPLPPDAPPMGPQSAPPPDPASMGPPQNPIPPRQPPVAGPPSVMTSAGPTVAPPPAPDAQLNPSPGLIRRSLLPPPGTTPSFAGGPLVGSAPVGPAASVNPATLPSSARVGELQQQVDASNARPSLMQRFMKSLPSLLVAGASVAARAPGALPGVDEGETANIAERDKQKAALVQQLDSAQSTRAAEYGAQQRAQEMHDVAAINSGAKQAVAVTGATAKTGVADITTQGRETVAGGQNQNRLDVQKSKNQGSYADAVVGANGRIQSAKYYADAAANRQTRSIDAAADRQQAGFQHSDDKPTADEDRRADLSKSLDAMADRAEEIISRRPDLVGPVAGRWMRLKNAVGTSDPDIAELQNIHENLGQLALATHTMRNAGHIETAANSMLNSYYNDGPAAIAGLESAKRSAHTMSTITRPTLVKPKAGTPTAPAVPPGADGVWDPVAKKVVYR